MSDNQRVILVFSTPKEESYNDLYQIKLLFDEICTLLKEARWFGLFLNPDPDFDSVDFHQA